MGDYLRIARVYLCRTSVAVWCFLFVCLLMVSALEGELVPTTVREGFQVARDQGGPLGGVLSRKSYLAMFAYFNACLLGVLLRDNIAQPWASVLPRYRRKHLLVTALIALFLFAVPMFAMEFVGTSDIAPMSVAVIFLTCLAAGLWTLHHPLLGFLAVPFLIFVFVRTSSSPMLAAFLAGASPVTSAALIFLSLLSLWALAWRLLALKEEMLEYVFARLWGDLLRGRGGQTFQGLSNAIQTQETHVALPADQRSSLQYFDPLNSRFSNLKQVDSLAGYRERSLCQRMQLWRLGTAPTRTSVSVGGLILLTLVIIPASVGVELPAGDIVVIFSVQVMTNPVTIWIPWVMRLNRLGYESLRPRTRQEFVRELGLALLWDNFQCWLGGVLLMGIAAAIWAPELLQVQNSLPFILGTGVGQVCAYALMGIGLLKQRGMVARVACAFCPFPLQIAIAWTMNSRIGIEPNIAIASVLSVASVATIALAYRNWCRADLD